MMKPVDETCNNACTYCYYAENRNGQAIKPKKMSLELAKKIIKDIAEYEIENKHSVAEIIWHGGEPLLIGIDFYEKVFAYQKTFPVSFKNAFQTNGELITQEWCDFFKRHDCNIGFSLDGPPEIHDQQRKKRDGSGTVSDVLRGIELCRSNGVCFGGILCVVTAISSRHPEEILEYFYSQGIKIFDFLAAHTIDHETITEVPSHSVSPEEFSDFMKKVFDWYLNKDDPEIDIRTVTNVMSQLLGKRPDVCSMQGNVCGTFLTFYSDGKVLFCDDYNCGNLDKVGDSKEENISQIVNGSRFKSMVDMSRRRLYKCKGCEVINVCNGGCPRDWDEKKSYFCSYYKDFYYYCYEKLSKILQEANS